ncbi:MAG: flagellar basal body P-ring formation chaperone FlgA [Bryobacteraceae bacterium]|jgi:flagella basal body P-ring formation protein FlgA
MKITSLLYLVLSCSAGAGCVPIGGDRILGRDLALADARFAALPATEIVGYAPAPGSRRIFAAAELGRIARAHGIAIENPAELCFEIAMRQVSAEEASAVMRHALPAGAEIDIVELSKTGAPAGELDFPLSGLEPPAPADHGVQLWRGSVKYAGTKKLPVWARVAVTQRLNAVVATRDLPENVPIDAGALRMEVRTGPIQHSQVALRIEEVLGHVPRKAVKAGSLIPLDLLDNAGGVRRGDAVRVEVQSGPARLSFEAIAEKQAKNGETVELRNPATGRIFRARLEGSKAVIVIALDETPDRPL